MKKILTILITGLVLPLFATGSLAAELAGVDIHGFISQGYLKTTNNNFTADSMKGTLAFNEVGINFGGDFSGGLRVGMQLFAREFGDIGKHEIKIDWALADYQFNELLGVRLGKIKIPHGLYNETRDVDSLRNPILLPQSVYQEVSRDIYLSLQGFGVYGYMDFNALGGISYQAMYGDQQIDQSNKVGEHLIGIYSDIIANDSFDVDYKYAGSLVWEAPLSGLRLGLSMDNAKLAINSRFTKDIVPPFGPPNPLALEGDLSTIKYRKLQNWIMSGEFIWNDLIVMAEYIRTYKDYDIYAFNQHERIDNQLTGWYVGGAYRFFDWLELGGYYSQTRNDEPEMKQHPPAPDFYNELDDICATMRFDFNEYLTLKFEGHSLQGAYGLSSWDNPTEVMYENFEKEWKIFAAKITAAF